MRNYKYFRKDTGEWEEVEPELWGWEVTYEDGKVLRQFGSDGVFHQFSEIDQSRLSVFKMISDKFPQVYTILFTNPKMKLIHYYKNTILNAATEFEKRVRMYCFGYEKKVSEKKTEKVVMMITPSGELIVTESPEVVNLS